jgi:thioredoxin 1
VTAWPDVLGQCPCRGGASGAGGISTFGGMVLLGLIVALWQAVRWAKSTWKQEGASAMRRWAKTGLVFLLVGAVAAVLGLEVARRPTTAAEPAAAAEGKKLPRLLDLGSKKCIPCKMMAPMLADLKKNYADRFAVEFIDVWLKGNAAAARTYGIRVIPTQIFFAPDGKELWRHEGFLSKEAILGKWKQLGYDFTAAALPKVERWEPARKDARTKDRICYMCDGDIGPKTAVVVKTDKGDVRLCGLHCYFIMYSALTEDRTGFEKKVSVTDWATGKLVPAESATYLRGVDAKGRPTVMAFASKDAARKQRQASGGNLISHNVLKRKELSHRCGFCDRAVYPEDSALLKVAGVHTWGCCPHCALGVAARTGKDIEVHQPDALTGERIVLRTHNGQIASLEPATAVAWFGMRKKPDGKWGSAGCFHQANFVRPANLEKWLGQHPYETGKLITIAQALAAKMRMTPQQIAKACKIGECAPK